MSSPTRYSVTIDNDYADADTLMLFQDDPASWAPDALALAWQAVRTTAGSQVRFTWEQDVGLSQASVGTLQPGVVYRASQLSDPAENGGRNEVTLDHDGVCYFDDPRAGAEPLPNLYVTQSPEIPRYSACAVGVTMAGSTVYAVQAQPAVDLVFAPAASFAYSLAFGDFETGQVLDLATIEDVLPLVFPPGVFALRTTLKADGTWTPPVAVRQAEVAPSAH